MGQQSRRRTSPRRHRRARRLQISAAPIPRRLRRILPIRPPNQKRVGKEMDRNHAREDWKPVRRTNASKNIRQNEVRSLECFLILTSNGYLTNVGTAVAKQSSKLGSHLKIYKFD